MIGQLWVAAILGVVMLASAAVVAARIVVARRRRRPTDYEIEVHNLVMGVSMGGMLLPSLHLVAPGPSAVVWLVVWVLLTLWLAGSVVRDARGPSRTVGIARHHLPHLVMSLAMVYMLAVMLVPSTGSGAAGMSGMGGGAVVPLPTVDYLLALFMIGYAVLVLDRLPAVAGHTSGTGPEARTGSRILSSHVEAVLNLVMAVAMAYMLVMMFV